MEATHLLKPSFDSLAVDINPDTFVKYRMELNYLGHISSVDEYHLYGKYLVATAEDGLEILDPYVFHRRWQFYVPETASRLELRAIIPRVR